jgi:ATP-dependent Clp protease ATP-binding subunit ClpB
MVMLILDVTNLLLQVLDEGFLTNSQGVKVDFRNTILIMTSNLGAEILAHDIGQVVSEHAKKEVLELVERYYPPEFLNRYVREKTRLTCSIDSQIVFNKLSKETLRSIVDLRLKEVQTRLDDRQITLNIDDTAKSWLTEHGYSPIYGITIFDFANERRTTIESTHPESHLGTVGYGIDFRRGWSERRCQDSGRGR